MRLIKGIEDSRSITFKPRNNISRFRGYTCLSNGVRLYVLLVLSVILFREALADNKHLVPVSEDRAKICARPRLSELLLSGNSDTEGFHRNIAHDRDAVLSNRKIPAPSRVIELNETTLEQVLASLRRNGSFTMILFYAKWCPFSRELRPTYGLLSSLFPSIYHVVVEGTKVKPSLLSKYGVHSYPLLFLYNKTSREKYQGSRTLKDLIMFLQNATGVNPISEENSVERQFGNASKFVTETDRDGEFCPFYQSHSPGKWLQNDTYLILATWFLVLRVVLSLLPWISSKLKRFWNRCHIHMFTKFKLPGFINGKPTHRTFAVGITELKGRHFMRRWSKPVFS